MHKLAVLAVAVGAFSLSACGDSPQVDDVDFARYCVDHVVNKVATDDACVATGDDANSRFQWAYSEVGHHTWSGDIDTTPDYVFIPIGEPVPYGVSYVRPYNYSYRAPLVRSSTPVRRASSVPYAQFVKTAPKLPANAPKAATPAPAAKAPAPPPAKTPNPGIQRGGFGVPSAPRQSISTPTFTAPKSSSSFSSSSGSRSFSSPSSSGRK